MALLNGTYSLINIGSQINNTITVLDPAYLGPTLSNMSESFETKNDFLDDIRYSIYNENSIARKTKLNFYFKNIYQNPTAQMPFGMYKAFVPSEFISTVAPSSIVGGPGLSIDFGSVKKLKQIFLSFKVESIPKFAIPFYDSYSINAIPKYSIYTFINIETYLQYSITGGSNGWFTLQKFLLNPTQTNSTNVYNHLRTQAYQIIDTGIETRFLRIILNPKYSVLYNQSSAVGMPDFQSLDYDLYNNNAVKFINTEFAEFYVIDDIEPSPTPPPTPSRTPGPPSPTPTPSRTPPLPLPPEIPAEVPKIDNVSVINIDCCRPTPTPSDTRTPIDDGPFIPIRDYSVSPTPTPSITRTPVVTLPLPSPPTITPTVTPSSRSGSTICTALNGGVQPPVINGRDIFNINNYTVTAYVQGSTDGGSTWTSLDSLIIPAYSSNIIVNTSGKNYTFFRSRCSSGTALSPWSIDSGNEYNYPNICGIVPPVVNGRYITNINDYPVMVYAQGSTDGGINWGAANTFVLGPNTINSFADDIGFTNYRARCSTYGSGDSLSSWNSEWSYSNTQNIVPPVVNGRDITNINDYNVIVYTQGSNNGGSTWTPLNTFILGANIIKYFAVVSGYSIYRARCSSADLGDSLSSWNSEWSYSNTQNIIAPIVNGRDITNINDYNVIVYTQGSNDGGNTWIAISTLNINSNTTIYNAVVSGYSTYRARCSSAGSGDSLSGWST